jgi:hypothetical protein
MLFSFFAGKSPGDVVVLHLASSNGEYLASFGNSSNRELPAAKKSSSITRGDFV